MVSLPRGIPARLFLFYREKPEMWYNPFIRYEFFR